MKWIVKNTETGSIIAGFMLFADASEYRTKYNTMYQTNAYTVEAFELYYKVK